MALKTFFFNNIDYYAEDFVKPFGAIIGNGIVGTNDLLVTPKSPNNLSVDVGVGGAFLNGYYVSVETTENIPITANTSGFNRIDSVCLKVDKNTQMSNITVIQGTPSASPVAPTPPTTDGVLYSTIAFVTVGNNVSTITSANIVDNRIICALAKKTQESFKNAALINGFSSFDANTTVKYMKDELGFVNVCGAAKGTATTYATVLFTLPVGYRPPRLTQFGIPCVLNNVLTIVNVGVNTAGSVFLNQTLSSAPQNMLLDCIRFPTF